jgi:Na+-transporting NADH:ubiquinone oxidoreductase subunit C
MAPKRPSGARDLSAARNARHRRARCPAAGFQAALAILGAEVANPKWQADWVGKRIYDETGKVRFHLVKGGVTGQGEAAAYGVDALSGATLTSNGVTDLLHYWLGDDGLGRYLGHIKRGEGSG